MVFYDELPASQQQHRYPADGDWAEPTAVASEGPRYPMWPDQGSRAVTDQAKVECMAAILTAWQRCPQMRLGQFLLNALHTHEAQIFIMEDARIAEMAILFAEWYANGSNGPRP